MALSTTAAASLACAGSDHVSAGTKASDTVRGNSQRRLVEAETEPPGLAVLSCRSHDGQAHSQIPAMHRFRGLCKAMLAVWAYYSTN